MFSCRFGVRISDCMLGCLLLLLIFDLLAKDVKIPVIDKSSKQLFVNNQPYLILWQISVERVRLI
jgi:hypothetical protein